MMKIILLRHGEPDIDTRVRLSPRQYGDWLENYNRASIKDVRLREDISQIACQCNFVVCSDLVRSMDSARALGYEHIDVVDPLFREFEIPFLRWPVPRLSASVWTVVLRLLWLTGYSADTESFSDAKRRAALCMQRLVEYAGQYGTVLFVGHGSLLWYLSKLLLQSGWHGPASSPKGHWELAVYHC